MKSLKESILNKRNIVSQGVEVTNIESLCKLLFDFIIDQKFVINDIDPVSSDTNLNNYTFIKKDLKVNKVTDIFNQTIKFFIDQNIEYKFTKNSKDYKKSNSLSFDLRDEYTINTESKNFSYPNIQIISYRFKGETRKFDNYIIFFTIVAPKEYKKYIS